MWDPQSARYNSVCSEWPDAAKMAPCRFSSLPSTLARPLKNSWLRFRADSYGACDPDEFDISDPFRGFLRGRDLLFAGLATLTVDRQFRAGLMRVDAIGKTVDIERK
jgi:hypothetical protein